MNPFHNLRVIELANVLAGPAVGMFFAELGAEVIKIENARTGGDLTRKWKLPSEPKDSDQSAYYSSVNYGKESRLLDLSLANHQAEVHQLIKKADIVLSNYKPRAAQKFRMDKAVLKSINPNIILAELNGFGPGNDRVAFDMVLQAESGFLYMNGEPGRIPVKMPVALIDILAGHQLKEAILIALLRKANGEEGGFHIQTSLLQSAIASLANQATNYLVAGHIPQRMGALHPNIAPYGEIFKTKDQKEIVLAVGTDKQFVKLCGVLGLKKLPSDSKFTTNTNRVSHRKELEQLLQKVIAERKAEELLNALHQEEVPTGLVRDMKAVFELPQAQKMLLSDQDDNGRTYKRPATVAFTVGKL